MTRAEITRHVTEVLGDDITVDVGTHETVVTRGPSGLQELRAEFADVEALARVFGVPRDKVRVECEHMTSYQVVGGRLAPTTLTANVTVTIPVGWQL